MRGKGWEERGPKKHSKNSDFGTPLIWVLFSRLPTEARSFVMCRASLKAGNAEK